jgi:hypothetical protein
MKSSKKMDEQVIETWTFRKIDECKADALPLSHSPIGR